MTLPTDRTLIYPNHAVRGETIDPELYNGELLNIYSALNADAGEINNYVAIAELFSPATDDANEYQLQINGLQLGDKAGEITRNASYGYTTDDVISINGSPYLGGGMRMPRRSSHYASNITNTVSLEAVSGGSSSPPPDMVVVSGPTSATPLNLTLPPIINAVAAPGTTAWAVPCGHSFVLLNGLTDRTLSVANLDLSAGQAALVVAVTKSDSAPISLWGAFLIENLIAG